MSTTSVNQALHQVGVNLFNWTEVTPDHALRVMEAAVYNFMSLQARYSDLSVRSSLNNRWIRHRWKLSEVLPSDDVSDGADFIAFNSLGLWVCLERFSVLVPPSIECKSSLQALVIPERVLELSLQAGNIVEFTALPCHCNTLHKCGCVERKVNNWVNIKNTSIYYRPLRLLG